jgi:hypothetical protein
MQENNCLKLPQMSNLHWCWKNEPHLNVDYNFDHQMSLSKMKYWYSNNRTARIRHHCRKTTVLSWHRCLNNWYSNNRTSCIRHQCRKTTVLSCNRCLNNTGVEKNEQNFNIDYNFDHQMSLSKMKYWYSNNRTAACIRHQRKKTTVLKLTQISK